MPLVSMSFAPQFKKKTDNWVIIPRLIRVVESSENKFSAKPK